MPKKTATILFQSARHLSFVVAFLGTLLFSLNKVWAFSAQTPNCATAANCFKKPAVPGKTKGVKGKTTSVKVPQKRIALEGIISAVHITFQHQITAWQGLGLLYFFVPQKQPISVYLARLPGLSFIFRIFPISIQPNAP